MGAHGGEGQESEPELAEVTEGLFQTARSTSSEPGGAIMDVLAVTSIHSKSPCHRVAPLRTGDMSRPSWLAHMGGTGLENACRGNMLGVGTRMRTGRRKLDM